jgi:hypothetical protein
MLLLVCMSRYLSIITLITRSTLINQIIFIALLCNPNNLKNTINLITLIVVKANDNLWRDAKLSVLVPAKGEHLEVIRVITLIRVRMIVRIIRVIRVALNAAVRRIRGFNMRPGL